LSVPANVFVVVDGLPHEFDRAIPLAENNRVVQFVVDTHGLAAIELRPIVINICDVEVKMVILIETTSYDFGLYL
jgi:hypothetical protein